MTKISLNGIGLVTVLAVSGSIVCIVFAKRSISQKYDQLLKQAATLKSKAKGIPNISRISLSPSFPDQFDDGYRMPGTFVSAKDETKNQLMECVSTVSFRLSVEKDITKGINDKRLPVKLVKRTDGQSQDVTRTLYHTGGKMEVVFPSKRSEDTVEKLMNNESSISVPPLSGSVCKVKKVRFAATVMEPKDNNREFRLRPKSSRLRQPNHNTRRLDSCDTRSQPHGS